jgi:TolA-binding protein
MAVARRLRAFVFVVSALLTLPALAAEKPRVQVDSYAINVELNPKTHHLIAAARLRFTALDDINSASFELNNSLRPRVLDAAGKPLVIERISQENLVRVNFPKAMAKGQADTITFEYDGELATADESPVEGLKLAYVGDTSYLLYPGRWFPVVNYGVDRFTADINITVPTGVTVIGSGAKPAGSVMPAREPGKTIFAFSWPKASFPGTIIAGRFEEQTFKSGGLTVHTYFTAAKKPFVQAYADSATKSFEYFSSLYGPPPSLNLNVVELPDDTLPTVWAPEIAGLASRAIQEKTNYRLLANTIAHQWWGVSVSPTSLQDAWLTDGFARYAQARYVEEAAGGAAYNEEIKDMSVGALAYDAVPLSGVGKLDPFSAEFQSLTTNKGAMILGMLRWVIGDQLFDNTVRVFAITHAGKSASSEEFQTEAEKHYGSKLQSFFSQWLDSTGAPEFKNKYTVYRSGKGFRVAGQISQDLDLFSMPVELKIDTDGKTELKRIEVKGTNSPYVVETFGKPRRISIDPNDHVLKNSSEFKVRVAIQRGQDFVQQGDFESALREFQKALDVNKNSSLAQYRIAEVFFLQRNYQAAANAYRSSLNGDGEPRWTEVWSHVQLGKIFDATGQRDRATNEYRQALQTNDNTQGALDEARRYQQKPYQREKQSS